MNRPTFKINPIDVRDECQLDILKSDLRRFFEGAKVAFSIFIESCKLVGNIYKRKFVGSLLVSIKYCQIANLQEVYIGL